MPQCNAVCGVIVCHGNIMQWSLCKCWYFFIGDWCAPALNAHAGLTMFKAKKMALNPWGLVAHIHQKCRPPLVQMIACRLGAKPLSGPMRSHCWLDPKDQHSVTFESKYDNVQENKFEMLSAKCWPVCLCLKTQKVELIIPLYLPRLILRINSNREINEYRVINDWLWYSQVLSPKIWGSSNTHNSDLISSQS